MTPPLTPRQFARQWAGKATSIALAMVIPGIIGIWLDRRLGSTPSLSITGFVFGFGYGMWRLIALAKATPAPPRLRSEPQDNTLTPSATDDPGEDK